jgi:hypothetical protein
MPKEPRESEIRRENAIYAEATIAAILFRKPAFVLRPETMHHERKGTRPALLTTGVASRSLTE